MPLVVDASVALAWALPDESSGYDDAVLAVVERDGLRVPELWAREIANGLAVAYLRMRITSAVIRDGTAAAIRHGLTAYDAAYVDLASRERLTLATLDTAMRKAAEQSAVAIFRP